MPEEEDARSLKKARLQGVAVAGEKGEVGDDGMPALERLVPVVSAARRSAKAPLLAGRNDVKSLKTV
jgi:hypothetical protein